MSLSESTIAPFERTITETDVYLWAGLTQAPSAMHLDEVVAASSDAGTRIVQGDYVLALMAEAVLAAGDAPDGAGEPDHWFEKARFIKPVLLGDTVTIAITASEDAGLTALEATRQDGTVVAAAQHRWAQPGDESFEIPGTLDEDGAVQVGRTIAACDVALYHYTTGRTSSLEIVETIEERPAVPAGLHAGLLSAASTNWCIATDREDAFSYGYDGLLLRGASVAGDTVRAVYRNYGQRPERHQLTSYVEERTTDGELVAAGRHILWHRRSN